MIRANCQFLTQAGDSNTPIPGAQCPVISRRNSHADAPALMRQPDAGEFLDKFALLDAECNFAHALSSYRVTPPADNRTGSLVMLARPLLRLSVCARVLAHF